MSKIEKIKIAISNGLTIEEAEKSHYVNNPNAHRKLKSIFDSLLASL